jgi:hypothetical protein
MKIGIVTHYYNSTNYGGILQSFALCKYLNENGCDAKQICYDTSKRSKGLQLKRFLAFHWIQLKNLSHPKAFLMIRKRKKSFQAFRKSIPHTTTVFSDENLFKVNSLFDVFLTGSDQVWHPAVINKGYSLSFCDKPKYSYAASIAADEIPADKKQFYDEFVKSFLAVSVRERNAQKLISVETQLVLDPVFLLSEDEWDKVVSKRLVDEDYVFCYFLGDSQEARNATVDFAHKKNLKVVNIPYLKNYYRKCDQFGDYSLSGVSPNDFLSLIKNARFVITDSFHAICFSFIFKKQFLVFNRKAKSNMGTRIGDILFTLDLQNRYCMKPNDILSTNLEEIDYTKTRAVFESMKLASIEFLNSIRRVEL